MPRLSLRGVLLCVAVSLGLPGCGDGPAPTFDRDVERLAVLRAVLVEQYGRTDDGREARRFVLAPMLGKRLPILNERDIERLRERGGPHPEPIALPDGRKARRPRFDALDEELVGDWAKRTEPSPTPAELALPHPIEWFTTADWKQLKGAVVTGGAENDGNPKWTAFHIRHPDSAGWICLSDVGFARGGRQALVYVSTASGSLAGNGMWFLLSKREGRWTIDSSKAVWVS